jgi:hypothetical protein
MADDLTAKSVASWKEEQAVVSEVLSSSLMGWVRMISRILSEASLTISLLPKSVPSTIASMTGSRELSLRKCSYAETGTTKASGTENPFRCIRARFRALPPTWAISPSSMSAKKRSGPTNASPPEYDPV